MTDPSALFAAAQAHHRAGRLGDARERCERLLAAEPQHGGALHMLGLIAFRQGEAGGAARHFSAAAALALARGDGDMALQRAVEALTADETPETRRLFAAIAGMLRFSQDDPVVRPFLIRALTEAWGPLAPLAAAASGLVKAHLAAGGKLEDDSLLRAALAAAPVTDIALEKMLTAARRALLSDGGNTAFATALAQQCFLNGYVFAQSDDETAQVAALRARIEAGDAVTGTALAVLACYVPLQAVAGIGKVGASDAIAALLRQQRDEPASEQHLAAALPTLTPLDAADSDETPWPRWSGQPAAQMQASPHDYLAARFPFARLEGLPETPATLIAGCGTGQYALHLARTLALGDITAIDLSRANLAFAARKAQEAGIAITFGQGDIRQAAALGRRFGLIECGGVLHQLADPLAGWRALLELLEPGGLMRVAVHSDVARAALAGMHDRLRREGFAADDAGIRAARHWLTARNDAGLKPVLEAPEFFSMGGCRHLLFPAGEHPLSWSEIAAFLRRNGLALIGLETAPDLLAAYRARFPQDAAATDLDNWAVFEQENPQSFAAMLQFWVQKRG